MAEADEYEEPELAPGYGARLRQAREEHPTRPLMSQIELARKLRYKRGSNLSAQVSAWEREAEKIPLKKRKPLAHALEVEYDWLVSNRGEMVSSESDAQHRVLGVGNMNRLEDLASQMRGINARLTVLENKTEEILDLLRPETQTGPRKGRTT